jgi:hypothetical protein
MRSGKFDTSTYTVDNNSVLTIQFENDDAATRILTLSNGITTAGVAQNAKVNLQSFTITGPISFSTVVDGVTVTGTINVR